MDDEHAKVDAQLPLPVSARDVEGGCPEQAVMHGLHCAHNAPPCWLGPSAS